MLVCVALIAVAESFVTYGARGTLSVRPLGSDGVRTQRGELYMGGKQSKFGVFSPAVYLAKTVLGEGKLNKLRGKGISLHSQVITEFCQQYGAYNLRLKLIKKAKKNGDILGFLV